MDRRAWGWIASSLLLFAGGWALVEASRGRFDAALAAGGAGLLAAGAVAGGRPGRSAARLGVGMGVGAALAVFAAPGLEAAAETLPGAFGLLRENVPRGLALLLPALAGLAGPVLAAGLVAWGFGRLDALAPWLLGASTLALLAAPFAATAPGWAGVPAGLGLLAVAPVLARKAPARQRGRPEAAPALRPGVVVSLRPRGSSRWLAAGPDGLVAPRVRAAGEAGSRFVVHRSREGRHDWLGFCADGAFVALEPGAPGGPVLLRASRTDVTAAGLFRFDGARLWSREGRAHLVLQERRGWLPWSHSGEWEIRLTRAPSGGSPFEVAVLVDAPSPSPFPFADGARVGFVCRVEGRDRRVGVGPDGRAVSTPLWEEREGSRFVLRALDAALRRGLSSAGAGDAGAFLLETPSGEPLGLRHEGGGRALGVAEQAEPLRLARDGIRCASGGRLALREDGSVVVSEEGAHGFWLADETFLVFRQVEVKEGERTLAGVSAFAEARAARRAARRRA